jgi:hypothetical protein
MLKKRRTFSNHFQQGEKKNVTWGILNIETFLFYYEKNGGRKKMSEAMMTHVFVVSKKLVKEKGMKIK